MKKKKKVVWISRRSKEIKDIKESYQIPISILFNQYELHSRSVRQDTQTKKN